MMPEVRPLFTVASAARSIVGMLAAAGVVLAGPQAAQATPSPTPVGHPAHASLSIAVTDSVAEAAPGDQLVYSVTVSNAGDAASGPVTVKLTLPGGVAFASADRTGAGAHGSVSWKAFSVPAAGHVTVTARGTVGTPAAGLNGLAGVACVDADKSTMLCASDIDQIPGRGDVHAVTQASGKTVTPAWRRWSVVAAGAVAVAVLGGVLLLVLRRRRRPRTAG
jgi:uncharacterized repeat protein (TIGR01451 family)